MGFDVDSVPLDRVEGKLNAVKAAALGAGTALLGVSFGLAKILEQGGKFEQTEVSFEVMLGSIKLAKDTLADLFEFARVTPFTISGVVDNAKQLTGMGFAASELIPTLNKLGSVAAGTGAPLQRLARNFGQIRARTFANQRDINEFATAGIGILEELSKITGKSTVEIAESVPKRGVTFDLINQVMINLTKNGGRFDNLLTRMGKTFLGINNKILDTFEIWAKRIGKELLPQAKALQMVFLNWLDVNNKIIQQDVVSFFKEFFRIIRGSVSFMNDMLLILRNTASLFGGVNSAAKLLLQTMVLLFGTTMLFAIGKVIMALNRVGTAALLTQVKILLLPILIGAAFAGVLVIIADVMGHFEGMDSVTGRLLAKFEKDFPKTFRAIRGGITLMREDFRAVKTVITNFWEKMKKAMSEFNEDVRRGVVLIKEDFKAVFTFFSNLDNKINKVKASMNNLFKSNLFDIAGRLPTNFTTTIGSTGETGGGGSRLTDFLTGGLFKTGFSPTPNAPSLGGGGNSTTTIAPVINVTASGGDANAIGKSVGREVQTVLDSIFTKASVATQPGIQ